nr:hypothetical protein [Clostridia bacterium]
MKKKGNGLTVLIVLLVVAFVAVAAVYLFKQYEYGVSTDYYDSLRGLMTWRCL